MPHGFHYTVVTGGRSYVSWISLYHRYLRLEICLMKFTAASLPEVRAVSHGFHYNIVTGG